VLPFDVPVTGWISAIAALGLISCVHRHITKTGWHGYAIPALVLLTGSTGFLAYQKVTVERPATAAAAEISQNSRVKVVCRTWYQEIIDPMRPGFVHADEHGKMTTTANLRRDVCNDLRDWLRSDKTSPTLNQVIAVHLVAHEAGHAGRGLVDEAETECWAVQNNAAIAEHMGANRTQARNLQIQYWNSVYPRLPSAYRTGACTEDGPFDLTPGDGIWP
jgi:hypothetical protein